MTPDPHAQRDAFDETLSGPPTLQPGDFVYLAISWAEPIATAAPFNERAGLLLGSGRYPVIERNIINTTPDIERSFLIREEDSMTEIATAPTLETMFDQQTANLLHELGFSSTVSFLTADLSDITSLPVDRDKLREMQQSLAQSLEAQNAVTIKVEEIYRWAESASTEDEIPNGNRVPSATAGSDRGNGEAQTNRSVKRSDAWPITWPTPGKDFGRSGALNDGRVDMMAGDVIWTRGGTGDRIIDAAPMIMDGRVYVWTNQGLAALDATSGNKVWEEQYQQLTNDGSGWSFSPQPPVGTAGEVFAAPQLTVFDAPTGDRKRSLGQWSTDAQISIADDQLLIVDATNTLRIEPTDNSGDSVSVDGPDGPKNRHAPAYRHSQNTAFVTDRQGALCAVNTDAGTIEWRVEPNGAFRTPSVGSHVYAVNSAQILDAITIATGESAWRTDVSHNPISDPATTDGRVYVTAPEGLYGIDSDSGETVLEYRFPDVDSEAAATSETVPPRPTIVEDLASPRVFSAAGESLYTLDPQSGDCAWTCEFDAAVTTQPVYANGRVYLRTADDRLHAIE